MSKRDKPAFPSPQCGDWSPEYGMTLREHYAGLAMQGMLASNWYGGKSANDIAGYSRAVADALIAELERTA